MARRKGKGAHPQVRLLPGYIILTLWVLFTFVLVGWIFAASFSTTREIFKGGALRFKTGLHFENYIKAWTSQNVSVFFTNSLAYSTVASVLLILVAAPAAYALSRFRFFANRAIQSGFVAAMGVPVVMIILPLFGMVSRMQLLQRDITVRLLMVFLYVGINVPYSTIFLLAFFSNLSRSYEEAAAIDGCSPIATFWKIMLPLAQPGIITVSIFNFINIWNEYFMSLIFANSDAQRPVAVGLYSMINSMKYTGDWAGMFAAVIIVFLPTFLLYIFLSEKIIAGVTGGIKG
ncbi:carbohydrate ABC transporter permease [Bacillota bacterium Meth-B3]|nr:carbohydrate ABC transporter permease [Christensenellaceae bacterium]MEA5065342.1 carbohydrate ABC transporter permease [Eubacteriales bacterium]MEA5069503.1 carbohydrate ABC transporter permease [Christensenellaceae bacterium]